jgi:prophage antirepressor-like protein
MYNGLIENAVLAKYFGPEWGSVRKITINKEEMYMAYDICQLLGITNVTHALKGVTGTYNVSPNFRIKMKIEDWNTFRKIHLLTLDGVFQLILNNKSQKCKLIKEYIASEVLPSVRFRFNSSDEA